MMSLEIGPSGPPELHFCGVGPWAGRKPAIPEATIVVHNDISSFLRWYAVCAISDRMNSHGPRYSPVDWLAAVVSFRFLKRPAV